MANELRMTGSLCVERSDGSVQSLQKVDGQADAAAAPVSQGRMLVGVTESAIPLGPVTSPGWLMLVNRDATGIVTVRRATGVHAIGKVRPGKSFGPIELGADMLAPFVISDTASTDLEYLVTSQ